MGQQPSAPITYDTDSLGLLPGDMFRYSLPNVTTLWQNLTGQDAGTQFAAVGITTGSPRQNLIYEGQVTDIKQIGGSRYYSYSLSKLWATTDPQKVDSPNSQGPWNNQSNPAFFGTATQPPTLISVPAQGGTGNFGAYSSLIPQYISENDPNFAPKGSFTALRPADIYKFLNEYSSLVLSRVSRSHPDYPKILAGSQKFVTTQQVLDTTTAMYNKYMKSYADLPVTVKFKGGSDTPMTARNFVDTPVASIVAPKTTKEYQGVYVDYHNDYSTDFSKIQEGQREYNYRRESTGANTAVQVGVRYHGDVVKTLTNIPLVKKVGTREYDILFTEIQNLVKTGLKIVAWTQTNTGGTTMTRLFSVIAPQETQIQTDGYVSGTVRGMTQNAKLGTVLDKVHPLESKVLKNSLTSNAQISGDVIRSAGTDYVTLLSAILAFERLNPDKMGYDQSLNTGRDGIDSAWRLSEIIKAISLSTNRAVRHASSIDSSSGKVEGETMSEGFSTREYFPFSRDMADADSPIDKATLPQREALLDAIEKRDAITVQLANASTDATTQMVGFFVSLAVFAGISLLPLPM